MIRTVSLETAKQLKEAGFTQDSYFWWVNYKWGEDIGHFGKGDFYLNDTHDADNDRYGDVTSDYEYYSSPSTDELLENLPQEIQEGQLCMTHKSVYYEFHEPYEPARIEYVFTGKLPEALAQCWLWLKKEGLL